MEIDLKTIEKLEKTVAKAGKTAAKKAHAEAKAGRMLTDQQEMFCQLFVKYGGDYKKAWTEAGYSTEGKYWFNEASKMRSRPHIWRRIEELRQVLTGEAGIDEQWILTKAKNIVDKGYLTGQLKDANSALELMAKILGCIKGDKVAAQAGIMQMNMNFFSNSSKEDIGRLAKAAGMSVIDAEAIPVLENGNAEA
jgi:hypothetical protein